MFEALTPSSPPGRSIMLLFPLVCDTRSTAVVPSISIPSSDQPDATPQLLMQRPKLPFSCEKFPRLRGSCPLLFFFLTSPSYTCQCGRPATQTRSIPLPCRLPKQLAPRPSFVDERDRVARWFFSFLPSNWFPFLPLSPLADPPPFDQHLPCPSVFWAGNAMLLIHFRECASTSFHFLPYMMGAPSFIFSSFWSSAVRPEGFPAWGRGFSHLKPYGAIVLIFPVALFFNLPSLPVGFLLRKVRLFNAITPLAYRSLIASRNIAVFPPNSHRASMSPFRRVRPIHPPG